MALFDSHLHLQDPRLESVLFDLKATYDLIQVEQVVVNATKESDWERVGQLSELFPFVKSSFGLHPWYLRYRSTDWLGNLEYCVDHYNGFIGEIGLDRWFQHDNVDDQIGVFRKQLQLAERKKVPASIHCQNAWGKMVEILNEETLPPQGVLLHSYGGSSELVSPLVKLGCYFSFSGYFLQERKANTRKTFQTIPLERILIETDAPNQELPENKNRFPLPADENGKVANHPGNIRAVYEGLADILKMPTEKLVAQVAVNYQRLFGD